tara:strand:- start:385 stop:690 length:306 start_codon:yes stop_codon:yes gene_type:complete
MPCYLTGKIIIKDIDRLKAVADQLGLVIKESLELYGVYHGTTLEKLGDIDRSIDVSQSSDLIKNLFKEYSVTKIKQLVQRKGWTITSIKQEDNKLRIKMRE